MDEQELRVYVKQYLEQEFEDAEIHYQGKRIVFKQEEQTILILITNAKI